MSSTRKLTTTTTRDPRRRTARLPSPLSPPQPAAAASSSGSNSRSVIRPTTATTTTATTIGMPSTPAAASFPPDELTTTVFDALHSLSQSHKANFLLDTSLALIEAGKYGQEVENYLEVYLRTPDLPKADIAKALIARGNARKLGGERLIAQAQQDFQAVLKLDPSNREIQQFIRRDRLIHFMDEPASHRAPPEVWERIASHIPRYHLRTWLFVSSFHRDIAARQIFHTIDLYFGGEDPENLNRGLDIFDRAKADPVFASRVKCLRLHWAYEEGELLDLVTRIFKTALVEFKSLVDFEWIGYPEMRAEMVQVVLDAQSRIRNLGLIGWHFDAVGVSAFHNLRKFTLRAEDDDGFADMGEVRTVLDQNQHTLRHLILGAYLERHHSWDNAFESATIQNLTHLDLVDTRISHFVLTRIAHAHNLQSLTLHGTFEEPASAGVMFGSDHIIDGKHTFLPHLEAFRFVLVGLHDEIGVYQSVVQFLRRRKRLRRLDLGECPWELVLGLLPELIGLRVLGVRIANLTQAALAALVRSIPEQMVAINLSTLISDKPLNEYASLFSRFPSLAFLHLQTISKRRPKPNLMSEKDFQVQTDLWISSARSIALALPSLDFVGWHGEHYVVVRSTASAASARAAVNHCAESATAAADQDAELSNTDSGALPASAGAASGTSTPASSHHLHCRCAFADESGCCRCGGMPRVAVELKELPARRRLDCGKGVDLGSEDATWLERKDVPMDYEMPGLE